MLYPRQGAERKIFKIFNNTVKKVVLANLKIRLILIRLHDEAIPKIIEMYLPV